MPQRQCSSDALDSREEIPVSSLFRRGCFELMCSEISCSKT